MDFRWDKFTVTQHLKEMGVMSDYYMPPENATKAGWRHLFFCQKSVSEELLYLSGKEDKNERDRI